MSGLEPVHSPAIRHTERTRLILLGAFGAWVIVTPYLGPLLGLRLDVEGIVEVVDHVVPGAVVVLAAALALVSPAGDLRQIAAIGLAFLAGFWVTATHVPLLAEAARDESPWDAAIWHNVGGLLVLAVALWLLIGPLFGQSR